MTEAVIKLKLHLYSLRSAYNSWNRTLNLYAIKMEMTGDTKTLCGVKIDLMSGVSLGLPGINEGGDAREA